MNSVKVQDTKLIYRNLLHFYTLTMNYQKGKLGEPSCLQLHQKRIKYQGRNLTKKVKDLYWENYRTSMKETEGDTNRYTMLKDLEKLILLK